MFCQNNFSSTVCNIFFPQNGEGKSLIFNEHEMLSIQSQWTHIFGVKSFNGLLIVEQIWGLFKNVNMTPYLIIP